MPTAITSQTVRVAFRRVSLTDDTQYYAEWDALTTNPLIVAAFEENIREDPEFTDVIRQVRTVI